MDAPGRLLQELAGEVVWTCIALGGVGVEVPRRCGRLVARNVLPTTDELIQGLQNRELGSSDLTVIALGYKVV